jgi:hypothetical protein
MAGGREPDERQHIRSDVAEGGLEAIGAGLPADFR